MTKSRKSASGTEAAAQEPAPAAEPTVTDDDRTADRPGREPGDLLVAMSPRQIIGGFAVLAGLIVMLRRRRRNRD